MNSRFILFFLVSTGIFSLALASKARSTLRSPRLLSNLSVFDSSAPNTNSEDTITLSLGRPYSLKSQDSRTRVLSPGVFAARMNSGRFNREEKIDVALGRILYFNKDNSQLDTGLGKNRILPARPEYMKNSNSGMRDQIDVSLGRILYFNKTNAEFDTGKRILTGNKKESSD